MKCPLRLRGVSKLGDGPKSDAGGSSGTQAAVRLSRAMLPFHIQAPAVKWKLLFSTFLKTEAACSLTGQAPAWCWAGATQEQEHPPTSGPLHTYHSPTCLYTECFSHFFFSSFIQSQHCICRAAVELQVYLSINVCFTLTMTRKGKVVTKSQMGLQVAPLLDYFSITNWDWNLMYSGF